MLDQNLSVLDPSPPGLRRSLTRRILVGKPLRTTGPTQRSIDAPRVLVSTYWWERHRKPEQLPEFGLEFVHGPLRRSGFKRVLTPRL